MSISPNSVVAVVRCSLILLTRASLELAEAEVAVGSEGAHAEVGRQRERPTVMISGRPRGGRATNDRISPSSRARPWDRVAWGTGPSSTQWGWVIGTGVVIRSTVRASSAVRARPGLDAADQGEVEELCLGANRLRVGARHLELRDERPAVVQEREEPLDEGNGARGGLVVHGVVAHGSRERHPGQCSAPHAARLTPHRRARADHARGGCKAPRRAGVRPLCVYGVR
jgi:hypothetical protein